MTLLLIYFLHTNLSTSLNITWTGDSWKTNNISWCVLNNTDTELGYNRTDFIKSTQSAFNEWERTGLHFYQEPCSNITKIVVSVQHTEHYFDGLKCVTFGNNIQGHATSPPYGELHIKHGLNLSLWYPNQTITDDTLSLYAIVLHEIGHTLGLDHNQFEESVMYEWNDGKISLNAYDISEVRKKYNSVLPIKADAV